MWQQNRNVRKKTKIEMFVRWIVIKLDFMPYKSTLLQDFYILK